MFKKLKFVIVVSLLFGATGFNSAKAITADQLLVIIQAVAAQVGQAFSAVGQVLVDHENRISNLENADPSFSGMSFSQDGAPKNVVVLARVLGNGNAAYSVRSRYATSTEQISINGVLTQRPFISNFAYAETDAVTGDLVAVSNYIEAPDTAGYVNYNVEQSIYDPVSLAKTVTADTLFESWELCSGGKTTICIVDVTLSANGDPVRNYSWSSFRGFSGPTTINGMTFDEVRLEEYASQNFTRVRAKGIGEVLRTKADGSWTRKAIFYRANGVSGGSLVGTPFDAGQPLDGLFF